MADGERYESASRFGGALSGVWDNRTGKMVSTDAPRPKTPTYRHAQTEAMKRGDSSTYYMRKTDRKSKRGKGRT
jgi:hypothetical protein